MSRRSWSLVALLFASIVASLFFHGVVADFFCATQILLLVCVFVVVWGNHGVAAGGDSEFRIPKSALALFVTLYWGWLALTLLWSPVPNYSKVTFWWLGSLPLVFWLYTLGAEKERLWRSVAILVLALAIVMAGHGVYQFGVHQWEPKSVFLDINSYAAFLALVALPVAGCFLITSSNDGKNRLGALALGLVIFVLSFAIAITGGRGVALSCLIALVLLLVVAFKNVGYRPVAILAGIVAAATVIGNLVARGQTVDRLVTVLDPAQAGFARFLIWDSTWQMLKQAPWFGSGLGTFSLLYPPFQRPQDSSAGFMVHNDYLQLWLEAGLPVLLLLAAIFLAASLMFVRSVRNPSMLSRRLIEITGLFCGLLVIVMHSVVNFNMYLLPTLIVAGLVLARFHWLVQEGGTAQVFVFNPDRYISRPIFRVIAATVLLMPVLYFLALALSTSYVKEGVALARAAKFDEADGALARAHRLAPDSDMVLVSRADLYRHVISAAPPTANRERRELFDSAVIALDKAVRLNPYRPDAAFVRARLYRQNAELAGSGWREKTIRAYEQAITLQPRFYVARLEYALFLLQLKQGGRAREVLEQGINFPYVGHERLLPYYQLTMQLRRVAGDRKGAEELAARIAGITAMPHEQRPIPFDQFKFLSVRELFQALLFWQRPSAEPIDILTPTASSSE